MTCLLHKALQKPRKWIHIFVRHIGNEEIPTVEVTFIHQFSLEVEKIGITLMHLGGYQKISLSLIESFLFYFCYHTHMSQLHCFFKWPKSSYQIVGISVSACIQS